MDVDAERAGVDSAHIGVAGGGVEGVDFPPRRRRLALPLSLPAVTLNRRTVGLFNRLYRRRYRRLDGQCRDCDFREFFFPLDRIEHWNRIYGRRGFYQYQFVLPFSERCALERLLGRIADSGLGSFLTVLKSFGEERSPGLLSFPRPGFCLALDFAERGARTRHLLGVLDAEIRALGGAVYPAKDRLMGPAAFRAYYPRHADFVAFVDPAFSSDFWRRVHAVGRTGVRNSAGGGAVGGGAVGGVHAGEAAVNGADAGG